jgi:SOS-response transcriptional repressor LexA
MQYPQDIAQEKPLSSNGDVDVYEQRRRTLRTLIEDKYEGTQARFAEAVGISSDYVSRLLKKSDHQKRLGEALAREWEEKLRLPVYFFDGVYGQPGVAQLVHSAPGRHGKAQLQRANVSLGPDIIGRVPLISWIRAGAWSAVEDPFAVGDAEAWLPCPVKHGRRTFVLRVSGISMYNPGHRPSYSDGDLIFVDPDRGPVSGDRVIAKVVDTNEATFKQLIIEGKRQYLKALNPAWPEQIIEIDRDTEIIGVVIGQWVD